ncbi:hypothetical protein CR513_49676, partial [Mucuna pruriens]
MANGNENDKDAEAKYKVISNEVMKHNTITACSKVHPQNCKMPVVNPYRRGCEPENRCRS